MSLLLAFLFLWVCYLAPAGVAIHRQLTDRNALTLVNLLLGWTLIGWFVCLLRAALGKQDRRAPPTPTQPSL